VPSGICTANQPLPCTATSKGRLVCCSGPVERSSCTLASTTKARVGISAFCTGTARRRCSSALKPVLVALARLWATAASCPMVAEAPVIAV
jgi:hypothetical protein